MKPKYEFGQEIWYVDTSHEPRYIPCVDCFGKRYLTVILGDDTKLTVPCETCKQRGWDDYSSGILEVFDYAAVPIQATVNRIEFKRDGTIEYGVENRYSLDESEIFLNREDAEIRAKQVEQEKTAESENKYKNKEKDTRSWSWHVTYHRRQIEDAKRTVEYATKKLNYALEKKREV